MKNFKKIFLSGLITVLVLLGSGVVGIWLGQDRIIALFVQEANQHLRTPVRVGHIEVSGLAAFPRVAITLRQVVVLGSLPHDTTALLRARKLWCAFDAWDLLAGRYRIRAAAMEAGSIRVRHDAQGAPNYAVFREDTSRTADKPLTFALETLRLTAVQVEYDNPAHGHRYTGELHEVRATLAVDSAQVGIGLDGRLRIAAVRLGADAYLRDKELTLATKLVVDRRGRQLTVQPSTVQVGPGTYAVAGQIGYGGNPTLALTLDGQHTDLQSVAALLPARLAVRLGRYRSRGDVYFRGLVQRTGAGPALIEASFGCRDASFYHPEYQESVEHVFVDGTFSNGHQRNARTSALVLRRLRGSLHGRAFSGSLRYGNLLDPTVSLDLRADLDVARVLRFYPVAGVRAARGTAQLAVQLAGNLRQFRQRPATAAGQAAGTLTLRNVSVQLRDYGPAVAGLSGTFRLRRQDVAVTNCTGQLGRSDFRLNGLFRNALGWLLLPRQPLLVEADVASRLLDLDQLLSAPRRPAPAAGGRAPAERGYALQLDPSLTLNLRAQVEQVRFRRLRGWQLRGIVALQHQVLSTPGLSVRAAGGTLALRGTLDGRHPELLRAQVSTSCTQLPLDSLFYVFEDFGQSFLTARHLRGTLTASADAELYFDGQLTPLTDRLEAEVQATVRNGELNNFAPLQKLSMVASREQLRHLRFAQLTNSIYIQSRTVYVPEMEIRSNVRTASVLRVTGTHTFDQRIDYHLSIPILPGLLRQVSIGGETATGPAILLAVQGTEDNFRVTLDRSRNQPAARRPTTTPGAGAAGVAAKAAPQPEAGPAPRKLFEVKKPEKKPAQPQPDQYFDF